MQKVIAFLIKTSRPRFWLYLGGTYLIGYTFAINQISDFYSWQFALSLLFFLIPSNIFVYGVNDYFDYSTDVINPKKKEKENLLEESQRGYLKIFLIIYGFLTLAFFIKSSFLVRIYLICFLFLAFFYSAGPIRFKRLPFLDFSSNILYAIPGFIGYSQLSQNPVSLGVIILAYFWTSAMHLFSAISDIEYDKSANITTSAVFLGKKKSLMLCFLLWSVFFLTLVESGFFEYYAIIFLTYPTIPLILLFRKNLSIDKIYWTYPYLNVASGFFVYLYAILTKLRLI